MDKGDRDYSDEVLRKVMEIGNYEPYIRSIRFPQFKNLEADLTIEFTFPITAIVGPNGCNKSSILRAIEGCPDYNNIGLHWFSTALDAISPGERHRFIHSYHSQEFDTTVEVLKTRIQRAARASKGQSGEGRKRPSFDPDYFEPSRPVERDGMGWRECR